VKATAGTAGRARTTSMAGLEDEKKGDMRRTVSISLLLFLSLWTLPARDRWSALSMLESGAKDFVSGPGGEVSCYQITLGVWNAYATNGASPRDPATALAVAQAIMRDRCEAFQRGYDRPPSDFEFYVLWNAPSQLLRRPGHAAVTKRVAARAERFCNLVGAPP
jgi:hypothetical protein